MEQTGQLIGLGLGLLAVSALIAARTSRRRVLLVSLLWMFAPALLMALTLGLGGLIAPPQGSDASNGIFAIMLIGTIIALPWMGVTGLGLLIGAALRRTWPPREPPSTPSAPPPTREPVASAPLPPTAPAGPPPQVFLPADARPREINQTSPDGSIRVDIDPNEWGHGQWVYSPRVVETATGRILCDLHGTDWQADLAFPRDRHVWLGLRRYRTPGFLFAEFDLAADRYRIALRSVDSPDEEGPIGDISDRLDQWWRLATRNAALTMPQPLHPGARPHRFPAWRQALLILIGAIVAIAGLSWYAVSNDIDAPHVPTVIRVPG